MPIGWKNKTLEQRGSTSFWSPQPVPIFAETASYKVKHPRSNGFVADLRLTIEAGYERHFKSLHMEATPLKTAKWTRSNRAVSLSWNLLFPLMIRCCYLWSYICINYVTVLLNEKLGYFESDRSWFVILFKPLLGVTYTYVIRKSVMLRWLHINLVIYLPFLFSTFLWTKRNLSPNKKRKKEWAQHPSILLQKASSKKTFSYGQS